MVSLVGCIWKYKGNSYKLTRNDTMLQFNTIVFVFVDKSLVIKLNNYIGSGLSFLSAILFLCLF